MKKDQTNQSTIIGIVLCVLFYMAYTKYLETKYPNLGKRRTEEVAPESADKSLTKVVSSKIEKVSEADPPPAPSRRVLLAANQLVLKNDKIAIQFSNEGEINSIKTFDFHEAQNTKSPLYELINHPLRVFGSSSQNSGFVSSEGARREGDNTIVFWHKERNGVWLIEESFHLPEKGYNLNISIKYKNTGTKPAQLDTNVWFQESIFQVEQGSLFFPSAMYEPKHYRAMLVDASDDLNRLDTSKYCKADENEASPTTIFEVKKEKVKYFGLESRYFLRVFMPQNNALSLTVTRVSNSKDGCVLSIVANQDQGNIQAGESADLKYMAYFGPKELETLASVDQDLRGAVDLGWFTIIARPLLSLLNFFFKLTLNYGIAIIIVTIILKLVFYPLTKQAAISAQHMKKIQPEMKRIQEKYKEDRQTMQLEMMKLYKVHKVNPAKSCLPILPTIPVFIAFYNVLMYAFELRQAPFWLWIQDLSAADPYYISPLMLGALMFLQMSLTPTVGMDKTQQRIMMMMPIIFTFAMISLPSGLVLYMMVNTILTILQQQWLNYKLKDI